jgi:hypothetical protein
MEYRQRPFARLQSVSEQAMSNETPVTLEQCIAWLCQALQKLPPMDRHYNLGETAPIINAILSHLRASAAKAGEGWQPIETAPQDGTRVILGWPGGGVRYGFYLRNKEWQGWRGPSMELPFPSPPPTHWQPLPAPPSAAPGEAKCPGCGKRFPSECDWCSEQIPRPDCAPSPEQQGAEQRGTCCATDCNNAASEGWYCMAHAEARAAELMAKVTAEDEPDGCDCPHASAARSCGCGFCRALNCTAPASALGLTQDERAAALDFAERIEGLNGFNKGRAERELLLKVAAFLRSMLERGKP